MFPVLLFIFHAWELVPPSALAWKAALPLAWLMRVIRTFKPESALPAPISERQKANKVVASDTESAIHSFWLLVLDSFGFDPATSTKIATVITPSSHIRHTARSAIAALQAMAGFKLHDFVMVDKSTGQFWRAPEPVL